MAKDSPSGCAATEKQPGREGERALYAALVHPPGPVFASARASYLPPVPEHLCRQRCERHSLGQALQTARGVTPRITLPPCERELHPQVYPIVGTDSTARRVQKII